MIGFKRELGFPVRDRGAQFLEALRAVDALAFDVVEAQALLGDGNLGLLQVVGQAVAIPRAPVHALFQVADPVADLLEFLLLDPGKPGPVILGVDERRHGEYQQEQGGQAAHGRTV